MIELILRKVLKLTTDNYYRVLEVLEQYGFFYYVVPFLIIFAILFLVLQNIKIIGKNKIIHILIAFIISLIALQFAFVSYFFGEVIPNWISIGLLILVIIFKPIINSIKKK